jgi:hypothetical protein
MKKTEIYRELKKKGIHVDWIGSTKKELQDRLDNAESSPSYYEAKVEFTIILHSVYEESKRDDDNTNIKQRVLREFGDKEEHKIIAYFTITNDEDLKNQINRQIENWQYKFNIQGYTILSKRNVAYSDNTIPIMEEYLRWGGLDIDGFVPNNEWNFNKDECVIDYIVHRFKGSRITRSREYIIKSLNSDTMNFTINNIKNLCKLWGINLYITHHNEIIVSENYQYGQKDKCLCFEIRNNHIYPYQDRDVNKVTNRNNRIVKKKEVKNYPNIEFIGDRDLPYSSVDYLYDTIIKTKCIPRSDIKMAHGVVKSFVIQNTLYSTNPYNKDVYEYCKKNNIIYTGQSVTEFILKYLEDIPKSFINHAVADALNQIGVKNRTHIGNPYNRRSLPDDIAIDINKCYRACIEQPEDDFMTIHFDTNIIVKKQFDNSFGLWYVITEDMTLLHRSNWYSNKIIFIALQQGIKLQVEQFIPAMKTNFSFKDIIMKLSGIFNPTLLKQAINNMIGLLGKSHNSTTRCKLDTNVNRVIDSMKNSKFYMVSRPYNDKTLYLYGSKNTYLLNKCYLPMWIQILDWSNIRLHNLILEHGGYSNLVYRKTDCAIMRSASVNTSNNIGGYKIEVKPIVQLSYTIIRDAHYHLYECKFTEITDPIDHILLGKSLLLTSPAGCGKSYIVREITKKLRDINKNTLNVAFTNKAANIINGVTLHSFFGLGKESHYQVTRGNLLIVDEISMVPAELWDHIIQFKNKYSIPILLVGDKRQLPPINEQCHFDNPSIAWLTDNNRCTLTTYHRNDPPLRAFLDEKNILLPHSEFNPKATHICYTNKRRRAINALCNKLLVTDKAVLCNGVYIDIDVPLCAIKTDKPLIKNCLYKISEFDITHFSVIIENREYNIDGTIKVSNSVYKIANNFLSDYFDLAYAVTTHKMQGDTVHGLLQVHEITNKSEDSLFYTAYSRATKLSNITYCEELP